MSALTAVRADAPSGEAMRVGSRRHSIPCWVLAALALGLGASCGGPSAPVPIQGAWQAPQDYPPKPPPKPQRAEAPRAAAVGTTQRAYAVVRGDTVYGIARCHGVPIRALIEGNRLQPPYLLRVGQNLVLHQRRYHPVARGETLYAISRLYGVDTHSLARLNQIRPPYTIAAGRRLLLPGPVAAAPPPAKVAAPASPPTAAPRRVASPQAPVAPPSAAKSAPAPDKLPAATVARGKIPRPPPRSANAFAWPVQGKIISGFGPKPGGLHNDGINIAGPRGTPVRAAGNGVVAYAGNE